MADEKNAGPPKPPAQHADKPQQEAPLAAGEQHTGPENLRGVRPFGVVQAGGEEQHGRLVASDPAVHESMPGKSGAEAVGSGALLPEEAAAAIKARQDAGIPEPPKVGPVRNVDLWDTPGGYQVVPAGVSPEQYAAAQAGAKRPSAPVTPEATEQSLVAGPGAE